MPVPEAEIFFYRRASVEGFAPLPAEKKCPCCRASLPRHYFEGSHFLCCECEWGHRPPRRQWPLSPIQTSRAYADDGGKRLGQNRLDYRREYQQAKNIHENRRGKKILTHAQGEVVALFYHDGLSIEQIVGRMSGGGNGSASDFRAVKRLLSRAGERVVAAGRDEMRRPPTLSKDTKRMSGASIDLMERNASGAHFIAGTKADLREDSPSGDGGRKTYTLHISGGRNGGEWDEQEDEAEAERKAAIRARGTS